MRSARRTLPFAMLLALHASSALAAERVAVLEFSGEDSGISARVLSSITDEARRAAVDVLPTDTYSVITRENQETILRDNAVDPNAMCDAACEVDLARTIGATLLVVGSAVRIGSSIVLNVKVFHADRGQVLKIVKVTGTNESDVYEKTYDAVKGMLVDGLGLRRDTVAERDPPPVSTGAFPSTTSMARVSFKSEPPGARVTVNGVLVCDATPCTADVPRQSITVRMDAVDYQPADDRVKALDGLVVALTLKPAFGLVRVTVDPPGLPLLVDGRPVDLPAGGLKLDNGSYTFATGDGCHTSVSERVVVERGRSYDVVLRARRTAAALTVDATVDGVTPLDLPVLVDGVEVGRTGRELPVWACASRVDVTGPEGLARSAPLSLQPGQKARLALTWSQQELDRIRVDRRDAAEQDRLAQLQMEADREKQAALDYDARKAVAFRETTVFWWNLAALSGAVVFGSLAGFVGFGMTGLLDDMVGLQFPTISGALGTSDGTMDIVVGALLASGGLTLALLGFVWFFVMDLSSTPVWPTDYCYDPMACVCAPLTPGVCLGVE